MEHFPCKKLSQRNMITFSIVHNHVRIEGRLAEGTADRESNMLIHGSQFAGQRVKELAVDRKV